MIHHESSSLIDFCGLLSLCASLNPILLYLIVVPFVFTGDLTEIWLATDLRRSSLNMHTQTHTNTLKHTQTHTNQIMSFTAMASMSNNAQTDVGPDATLTLIPSCYCYTEKDDNNDDGDNDDDDLNFLSARVFPMPSKDTKVRANKKTTTTKSKKEKPAKSSATRSLVADTHSSSTKTKDNNSDDEESVRLKEKRNDPAWVEDQGKDQSKDDQC
jgi:hypothetical protein